MYDPNGFKNMQKETKIFDLSWKNKILTTIFDRIFQSLLQN